jgi:hypothetical protein
VAQRYYKRQVEAAEQQFVLLARFLEQFSAVALRGENVKVNWNRDENGRISNANVTVQVGVAETKARAGQITFKQSKASADDS